VEGTPQVDCRGDSDKPHRRSLKERIDSFRARLRILDAFEHYLRVCPIPIDFVARELHQLGLCLVHDFVCKIDGRP
jgi:hypothetical protein